MCCNGARFSRQQKFILCIIGSVHFASAICTSLQAPFYPIEAESKNATATEYGFVFGIYELASFIASPLLGNYIDYFGAKCLLNSGIVIAAICSICFGLLELVKGHVAFMVLSFVVRMIEAVGASAAITSAFAITAVSFPDNVATTFATLEIFYGLGYIIGPTLGGILYSIGGFMLPFLFMGGVLLLDGVAIWCFLPSTFADNETPRVKGRLCDIIRVPAVLFDSLAITSVTMCLGFYSATLEPHIREFELTPIALGFIFIVHGATYATTAPFVGRLNDIKAIKPRYVILLGSVLAILSVICVGPAPFIPIPTSLPMVIGGLILLGLAMTCILVSAFIDAIRSSIDNGFPDDISTYGLVSGLWAASFSLGDFIGPSVAGFLEDFVGFRWGSMFLVAIHSVLCIALMIFIFRNSRNKYKELRSTLTSIEPRLLECDDKERQPFNVSANWAANEYGGLNASDGLQSIMIKG